MRISARRIAATLFFVTFLPLATHASPQVSKYTSPAGHGFFYVSMADAKRTAVAVTWKSGLPTGPDIHEATARLGVGLMLRGGSGGVAPDEVAAEFEDLDAASRLWVQPGVIRGFVVAPQNNLVQAAHIANLVLTRPDLEERWLDREKSNLIRGNTVRDATATGLAWKLAREIILGDHPYKRFWTAAPSNGIRKITTRQISDWHEHAFGTANLTITAAGSADPVIVGRAIDLALDGLPKSANQEELAFAGPDIKPGLIVLHDPDLPKSLIMTLGKLPDPEPGDDAIYRIATEVLGLGKQSRLFKAIRSQLRASYGFGAGMEMLTRNHRLLRMSGEVDTDLLPQALSAMQRSYETFRLEGITEEEYPIARNFHRQRVELGTRRPAGAASMLMDNQINGGAVEVFENLIGHIDGLERSTVNNTIRAAYPPYDELLTIVVTPDANAIPGACVITGIADWPHCF